MTGPNALEGTRCLVTGGLGFMGSNLAHRLVGLGADVTILDACIEPYGWNYANVSEIKSKIKIIKGDIRDSEIVAKAMKDQDILFHCAGQVSHIDSMSDPFLDIDINVRGAIVLLEAARKEGDAKLIYCGTRGQMGSLQYAPADEKHPDLPTDIYGVDKLAAEKYFFVYHNAYGMYASSIRLNNTYGERHQMKHSKYGVLNWFIRLAMEGKEIQIYGDGAQKRDYNYISDSVEAMVLAAANPKANGQAYLTGSAHPISILDAVKKIITLTGTGSYKLLPWPKERKAIEVGDFYVSFDKIKRELGWEPKVSFDEGLKRTIEFYRAHRPEYFI